MKIRVPFFLFLAFTASKMRDHIVDVEFLGIFVFHESAKHILHVEIFDHDVVKHNHRAEFSCHVANEKHRKSNKIIDLHIFDTHF